MKKNNLLIALITINFSCFQLLNQDADAQVCFTPSVNYSVGTQPYSMVSSDLNGDNEIDLAVVNRISNNVSILLGDGFGSFGMAIDFMVGSGPRSINNADFNGDGNMDLVTANSDANNVSVLLGDGLGSFGVPANFIVGENPYSVICADFNGDNKVDLATANFDVNGFSGIGLSVLLGDGLGGFGLPTGYAVGVNPRSVTSADFNGDGKLDLAVANSVSYTVSILLGDGSGHFSAVTDFSVGNAYSPSIINTDFNDDGKVDLATPSAVLLGDGLGNFAPIIPIIPVGSAFSVISLDLNGDNKLDLVIPSLSANNLSVLLGDGTGNFGSVTNNQFSVGDQPVSVLSADFNGDGRPDLAAANRVAGNISILLNTDVPIITATASADTVCAGMEVILSGGGAISYMWSDSVVNDSIFIPDSTATYTVTGATAGGCLNTSTKTIVVHPIPTATLTTHNESYGLYCDGSIAVHLAGGTGIIQTQWFNSIQTLLSSNDSVSGLCPGVYTLHLTDANNCTNNLIDSVLSGSLPPIPSICMVTVDSTNTHNLVIWEKTSLNMTSIDSFIVYREFGTNSYQQIGVVSRDSLSAFDDFISNPNTTGYRYKLESKNFHGAVSSLSNYHNTIYLTNTDANFSWTQYQVENNTTPVFSYHIYRDDNSTGNFQDIGNTTGNQFGYTDVNYSLYPNASYYVEAVMTDGNCSPTRSDFTASRSNIKYIGSNGITTAVNNLALIKIYPSPAITILNVVGIKVKTTLFLYDVIGKLVIKKEVDNDTNIDVTQFKNGVYTLVMEMQTGKRFDKIVIGN